MSRSSASIPVGRDSKPGWYATHNKHVRLAKGSQSEYIFIGDSIVAGFSRYKNVWHKYFNTSLNLGIGGDRTQHVLWRSMNIDLNPNAKYVIIHCRTNNVDKDQPRAIGKSIMAIGRTFQNRNPQIKVLVTGILPRDTNALSVRRSKIDQINNYLDIQCTHYTHNFFYLQPDNVWVHRDGSLDQNLFFSDNLHLIELGYNKFANSIVTLLKEINRNAKPTLHIPQNDVYAIGQSEFIGRGWDGSTSNPLKSPCSSQCLSSVYVPPSTLPVSISANYEEFPPLPPPLLPSFIHLPSINNICSVPKTHTLNPHPRISPCSINVCKPVRPCPVNVSSNVCKSVPFRSIHISPLRKLNKVKPPKWEKCDYVHVPTSPVSCSVPCPVPRRVPRNVPRRKTSPVTCSAPSPVTCPIEQGDKPRLMQDNLFMRLFNLILYIFYYSFNLFSNICLFNINFLYNILLSIFKSIYIIFYFVYSFIHLLIRSSYKLFFIVTVLYIFIIPLLNCNYIHISNIYLNGKRECYIYGRL